MLSIRVFTALISICSAQSTVNLFIPDGGDNSLVGSVVSSDATATTYLVGCSAGTDASDCGFPEPFSVTQGPSTVHYSFGVPDSVSFSIDCALAGTTSVSCVESLGGADVSTDEAGVMTTSVSGSDVASLFVPVTLVTNANQITSFGPAAASSGFGAAASSQAGSIASAGGIPTVTAASSTGAASTSGPTATASESSGTTGVVPGSGSATATAASKTSTGGMVQITGNAGWVVGGIAAAVAIAGL